MGKRRRHEPEPATEDGGGDEDGAEDQDSGAHFFDASGWVAMDLSTFGVDTGELISLETIAEPATEDPSRDTETKKKKKKQKKQKKQKVQEADPDPVDEGVGEGAAELEGDEIGDGIGDEIGDEIGNEDIGQDQAEDEEAVENEEDHDPEVSADVAEGWAKYSLHPHLLGGISSLGFSTPTPIQAACLPLATTQWRDIVGAAETGSGKTLAFGLPILHKLLSEPTLHTSASGLPVLIVCPTRELALQVQGHLSAVARHTGITVVGIVGGLASVKQQRQLAKKPQIVVGTPGRVWDLIERKEEWLANLAQSLRFLVLDEADRMIEKGYFAELDNILDTVFRAGEMTTDAEFSERFGTEGVEEADEGSVGAITASQSGTGRQVFLFSATLAFQPITKRKVRKGAETSVHEKMDRLMDKIQFQNEVEHVDLSPAGVVASSIEEYIVHSLKDDKDVHLYHALLSRSCRTLVFFNTISNVRRVHALLGELGLSVTSLHASMQQRQRLAHLDRFKANAKGVLIATDVAARGLDIASVDMVVHYDLPTAPEVYIHRCGRTGRAGARGISVAIVGPQDQFAYRKLNNHIQRSELPELPLDVAVLPLVRKRVRLAKQLETLQHQQRKQKSDLGWFEKTAQEMDIELDETILDEEQQTKEWRVKSKRDAEMAQLKQELTVLLKRPLTAKGVTNGPSRVLDEKPAQTANTSKFKRRKKKK